MTLNACIESLCEDGRVVIRSPSPPCAAETQRALRQLTAWEQRYRLGMPGQPPEFCIQAGLWAATKFYRACQFTIFREIEASTVEEELHAPCPEAPDAATNYSVDLVFHFLPDLWQLARSAAEHDPLLDCLNRWAREWPLSSVGMAGIGSPELGDWIEHPSLLILYTDRVVARRDRARARHPAVLAQIRRGLGNHAELDTEIAEWLQSESETAHE